MASKLPFVLFEDAFTAYFLGKTFKAMMVTSSYTPSQSHTRRSDITNEVSGTGYTAGGIAVTCSISRASGVTSLTFTNPTWTAPVNGFTARWVVVYVANGGASSADQLIGFGDFTSGVAANGTGFTVTFGGAITATIPTVA